MEEFEDIKQHLQSIKESLEINKYKYSTEEYKTIINTLAHLLTQALNQFPC